MSVTVCTAQPAATGCLCLWLRILSTGVSGLYRRDSFTLDSTEMPQGAGSGIIWDDDGHVVTNLHVSRALTTHNSRWAAHT